MMAASTLKCPPVCHRFTADVRSVLSRNLHQHRLWWLAELRGIGLVDQPLLSAGFHPALHSHVDDPPALSEPLLRWPPHTGWTVWDQQNPRTTGEGGGASFFFSFFFFVVVFFLLVLYLYFFFSSPKQRGASLPYRSWYWLCVYGVGVRLLTSLVLFKKIWR